MRLLHGYIELGSSENNPENFNSYALAASGAGVGATAGAGSAGLTGSVLGGRVIFMASRSLMASP